MYDCHLHTKFSFDGKNSMEIICETSLKNGMAGICFTDHVEYDCSDPDDAASTTLEDYDIDISGYNQAFAQVKSLYGNRLQMGRGIEIGLQPQVLDRNLEAIKKIEPDFIIGSIHSIEGADIYSGQYSAGKSQRQTYLGYLESTLNLVNTHNYFDVLGHLDMVLRDSTFASRSFDLAEYYLLVDDILTALIKSGRGIEVNSSGWRYDLDAPHPGFKIIKRYYDLGGRIITTGSDSHYPNSINKDIDTVTKLIKEAGFSHVSFFLNRKEERKAV